MFTFAIFLRSRKFKNNSASDIKRHESEDQINTIYEK